ncbi:MAG: hypothetical protein IJ168_07760 [Eubacterium sp.]|nr:hypothetical protein [Eubacterium sp.]
MDNNKHSLQRLVITVVALIGAAVSIVCFIWRLNSLVSIRSFSLIAVYYGFVFYYGIFGYRKPHGNMVRYLLLILAVYIAYSITVMVERWDISWIIFTASNLAAVFIAYIAGRLNKYKKNAVWAVIITALLLVKSFWPIETTGLNFYILFVLDRTLPLFMWVTVMFIYFFRYKEHKLAGASYDAQEKTLLEDDE